MSWGIADDHSTFEMCLEEVDEYSRLSLCGKVLRVRMRCKEMIRVLEKNANGREEMVWLLGEIEDIDVETEVLFKQMKSMIWEKLSLDKSIEF